MCIVKLRKEHMAFTREELMYRMWLLFVPLGGFYGDIMRKKKGMKWEKSREENSSLRKWGKLDERRENDDEKWDEEVVRKKLNK